MVRRINVVSLVLVGVLLAGCGGGGASQSAGAAKGSAGGASLTVSGKDIAFAETTLSAPANQPININFRNVGALEHSIIFDLPPAGDKGGDMGIPKDWTSAPKGIPPGKSETLVLPALPAGEYKYYCHVPGHETMIGTLTVK